MTGLFHRWLTDLRMGLSYIAWELCDDIKLVYLYYRKPRYIIADIWLQWRYFFTPLAQLCRWALRDYPNDQVQRIYGETSIPHFATLCEQLQLTAQDRFFELGCGRGRLALWLACHTPCQQVIGIDLNPIFIRQASAITQRLGIRHLYWQQDNFLETYLNSATIVYLYGTAFNKRAIAQLAAHFSLCQPGTRIITVSYALDHPAFITIQQLRLRFVWGETDVFIQRRC